MADKRKRDIVITAPTQILVEGIDELNFFQAFIRHAFGKKKSSKIQVHSYEGIPKFKKFLRSFSAVPQPVEIRSVGIVRDADESETSALQSLRDTMESADLNWPIPDEVNIPAQGAPSVTALILPGDGQPGALETLLCDTLRDELTTCIDEYFECAERWTEAANQLTAQRDKGRAKVYLAARKPPDISVSSSVQSEKYWDFDHHAFGIVRDFLEVVSGTSGFPLPRE